MEPSQPSLPSSPETFDIVIQGGTIVTESTQYRADIGVRNGVIALLREDDARQRVNVATVIDASGKYVLPGAIDCHVHFRQPGYEHKEDWSSGTIAAAFGGVTTVFEMPNTDPPTDSADRLHNKRELAQKLAYVDFGLYGLITDTSYRNIDSLYEAGAAGFKCYLSNSTSARISMISDGTLLEAFENVARLGARCVIHAENGSIIEARTRNLMAQGRTDALAHAESRPMVSEVEAVTRAIVLAEATGAAIHIAHESTAAGLDVICAAKARGVDVTLETCPQYLLLGAHDLERLGGIARCNPPLRQSADRRRLWDGIRRGDIDILATDHAPHTAAEKLDANIWHCHCGMPGVETAMSLMLTQVARGELSISDYVRLASTGPAKLWGLYPRKGAIQIGSDADIVIVDPDARMQIDQQRLHSKSRVSAWHGWSVQGMPVCTLVRGRIVMRDGELVGEAGWGRYVEQTRPLKRSASRSTG